MDSRATTDFIQVISAHLESLTITGACPGHQINRPLESLFNHSHYSIITVLPVLTRLSLSGDLSADTGSAVSRYFRFPALTEFRLRGCANCSNFLGDLAKVFKKAAPPLKIFELSEHDCCERAGLCEFLQSFKGLEKLYIALVDGEEGPTVTSITNHSTTLTTLFINTAEDDPYTGDKGVYEPTQFSALIRGCPQLEQLAISIPWVWIWSDTDDVRCDEAYTVSHRCSVRLSNSPADKHA